MTWSRLQGEQYVRLGQGAAEAVAPYLGVVPTQIDELLIDLFTWPEHIRPAPIRGWDGRLIAGDPMLVDANDGGLIFATGRSSHSTILVGWKQVRSIHVIGGLQEQAGA